MTEQKTAQLNVNEWKAVCLQGVRDLQQFLESIAYPNDEAISKIDQHMARWAMFMRSWKLHGEPKEPEGSEPQVDGEVKPEPVKVETKRKGGWPKGRARKPKTEQQATVQ